jgi:hypothetical protein
MEMEGKDSISPGKVKCSIHLIRTRARLKFEILIPYRNPPAVPHGVLRKID